MAIFPINSAWFSFFLHIAAMCILQCSFIRFLCIWRREWDSNLWPSV